MIHADNRPVKILSMADQSKLYIGLLWHHRHTQQRAMVRNLIRAHVRLIRKGRDVLSELPNTPEKETSACSPCVASHEVRAVAARGSRMQIDVGRSSALAAVSAEAVPEKPGGDSTAPQPGIVAGLGCFSND